MKVNRSQMIMTAGALGFAIDALWMTELPAPTIHPLDMMGYGWRGQRYNSKHMRNSGTHGSRRIRSKRRAGK